MLLKSYTKEIFNNKCISTTGYLKHTDISDYEDVPEEERKEVAQSVAIWVMDSLNSPSAGSASPCAASDEKSSGCCG